VRLKLQFGCRCGGDCPQIDRSASCVCKFLLNF
jgi:hypothetical protein